MRKYRNLVSITIILGFFALVMLISPVLSISAVGSKNQSPQTKEVSSWTLSPIPASLGKIKLKMELTSFRTPMLTTQSLMPLKRYSDAVLNWEAASLSAQQAELAAQIRAASASTPTMMANASTSLVDTTTANVATYARDALGYPIVPGALTGSLWGCIENAESTDRPYITSGLFGILVSTWRAYPDYTGGYSDPGAAPLSVQNGFAMMLYEKYGWGPWRDHCTE